MPNSAVPFSADVWLFVAAVVLVGLLPLLYLLINRPKRPTRALLLISTDLGVLQIVENAARQDGYQVVHVYRHEDVIPNGTLKMIVIDDSVPQSEGGLLLAMFQRASLDALPLILIQASSEAGQTVPAYRADILIERPISVKVLHAAISQLERK